jgi:hypothetical protein
VSAVTDSRAEDYLADVRRHLGALSDDERDDLLDDLAAHVHEVAASDDGRLEDVLGTPESFAAELLAAAGLVPSEGGWDKLETVRRIGARLAESTAAVRHHPWASATIEFLPQLRPAWWVARGWLLVYGLWLIGADEPIPVPVPTLLDSAELGGLVGAVAVVASVRLGMRTPPVRWRAVVDLLAVVALVVLLAQRANLAQNAVQHDWITNPAPRVPELTHPDGGVITNIHAYDETGRPLDRIRLYDQSGRPIETGHTDGWLETDVVLGTDGLPVANVYPLDQYTVPGGGAPGAREPVAPPALAVPALPPNPAHATTPADESPPPPGS